MLASLQSQRLCAVALQERITLYCVYVGCDATLRLQSIAEMGEWIVFREKKPKARQDGQSFEYLRMLGSSTYQPMRYSNIVDELHPIRPDQRGF